QLFKVGLQNLIGFDSEMKTVMRVGVIGGGIIGEWGEGCIVVIVFGMSEGVEGLCMERGREWIG
ncbi:hypothetical protein, partial [Staphylococcus saprophyticus]|uniref:hypothetical protein n=1 Tax=Staphylococcus saprophyticus TaxID=29385 RepID=UPI001C92F410